MIPLAIKLFFSNALALLGNIPWQVWLVVIVLVSNPISYCTGKSNGDQQGYDRRTAEYVALMDEARQKAAVGDKKAAEASAQVIDAIEAENKRAVEAAAGSDDPLKTALDALGK